MSKDKTSKFVVIVMTIGVRPSVIYYPSSNILCLFIFICIIPIELKNIRGNKRHSEREIS